MTTFYLNGQYVPRDQALIPVEDRGFIFGDGIYEGVRYAAGRLFEWDAHAERMANGLAGLRIPFGAEQVAALKGVQEKLVRDNGLEDGEAFLYLEVTRGARTTSLRLRCRRRSSCLRRSLWCRVRSASRAARPSAIPISAGSGATGRR